MIGSGDSICDRFTRLIGVSIVALGFSLAPALGDEAPMSKPFNVTAKIHSEPGHRLELTLTNTSAEPLRFFNGVLSRTTMSVILARDSAFGGVLDEVAVIDDPPAGEMTLNPSASYSHFIDLNVSFPSLSSELQRGALVVFWTATISTSDTSHAAIRFGGYLLMPPKT